jgi:hypothetical protein
MSATRSSSRLAAKPRVDYREDDQDAEEELPMAERFIKLLRKDEIHHGLQFKTGLNVDNQPWRPQVDCAPGGIYFCRLNQLHRWLDLYNDVAWCRWVSIPADAEVVDCGNKLKFKANKVILSERVPIEEIIREYFDVDKLCKLKPLAAAFMDPADPKCIEAVRNDPTGNVFRALRRQTPEICLVAVSRNLNLLQYVRVQTPEVCRAAVKQSAYALFWVREPTQELCTMAMENDANAIYYTPPQFKTPELCMSAVQRQPLLLRCIENQTFDLCMAAVSRDGYALQFVKLPATEPRLPELYAMAVAQHGCALQFVPPAKRTYELCLAAVKKNGYALKYVDEWSQTPTLCAVAVAKAKHAAKYMLIKHDLTAAPAPAPDAVSIPEDMKNIMFLTEGEELKKSINMMHLLKEGLKQGQEQKKATGLKGVLMNLTNKLHSVKVHPSN